MILKFVLLTRKEGGSLAPALLILMSCIGYWVDIPWLIWRKWYLGFNTFAYPKKNCIFNDL